MPARIGKPRVDVADKLGHPVYSTALGLLYQGLSQQIETAAAKPASFFSRVKRGLDRLASV